MASYLDNLLLHDKTKQSLDSFMSLPSHALMLVGPSGSGKDSLSRLAAAELLGLTTAESLENYPYITRLSLGEQSSIAVAEVRGMVEKLQLRTPGTAKIRRIAIIENAETMTTEAQNALLKSLEEPPIDTVFILNVPSVDSVLSTIASRSQAIRVLPIGSDKALQYFKDSYSPEEIQTAWNLSQGQVGLLAALLSNSQDHSLKIAIDEAKSFLRQTKFERLIYLENICKDKIQFEQLLQALQRIITALHHVAISKGNDSQASRLLQARVLLADSRHKLSKSAQPRLLAMRLGLGLSV